MRRGRFDRATQPITWHPEHGRPPLQKTQGWGTLFGNGAHRTFKGGPPAPSSPPTATERMIPNLSEGGGNTLNGKEHAVRNDGRTAALDLYVCLVRQV